MSRGQAWVTLLVLVGLCRGLLYAALVPPWQSPDEPGHYEYVRLTAALGRLPSRGDTDPQLEREILASLQAHRFWYLIGQPIPSEPLLRLSDDPWLRNAGRQVGAESGLYYILAAPLVRQAYVEAQVRVLRAFSVGLYALTILAAALAATRVFRTDPVLAKGIAFFFALAPMPTFVGSIVNNDALANALGAAFFAILAAVWRRRWGLREASAICATLILALAAKRTCWYLLPTLPVMWGVHRWVVWRVPSGAMGTATPERLKPPLRATGRGRHLLLRRRWGIAAGGLALLIVLGWVLAAADPQMPAGWRLNPEQESTRHRIDQAHSGQFGLLLDDLSPASRSAASQTLSEGRITGLPGREVVLEAWIRGERLDTTACLILDDGVDHTQACFTPSTGWQSARIQHVLAEGATQLRVVLSVGGRGDFAATGSFVVDDLTIRAEDEIIGLANSGFETAASVAAGWLERLEARLSWPDGLLAGWLSPVSYRPARLERYALYVALTFAHFWGDFGWLQLPLSVPWYGVLAVVSGFGLLGLIRRVRRTSDESRRYEDAWLLACAGAALLALLGVYLPMIGQNWQPQGRYLFPALVPLVTLLVAGLAEWLPNRLSPIGRRGALAAWVLLLFAVDQTALWHILYRTYSGL